MCAISFYRALSAIACFSMPYVCSTIFQDNHFIMNKKYLGYGLMALGFAGAAYYVWGLSTVSDRAAVTKVDIVGVGLTRIKLDLTIVNFATISIPFNGFKGRVTAQGYTISNVYQLPLENQKTIPAGGKIVLRAEGSMNWSQVAALIPDIINQISSGNWRQVIVNLEPQLTGDLYSNNLSASVDMPLV